MKVKVNRLLREGYYHVNFEISDFTPEELSKMKSFGVPQIGLTWGLYGSMNAGSIALNKIGQQYDAGYRTEADAKKYEAEVLGQIRMAMEQLRNSQDKFTSSEEVAL